MVHPDIIAVNFDNSHAMYQEFERVFSNSIRANTGCDYFIFRGDCDTSDAPLNNPFATFNTDKLSIWCDAINQAQKPLVFSDIDMMWLADPVWTFEENDFDVAITVRPDGLLNGGIVYARPTDAARKFFELWKNKNQYLYDNPDVLDAIQSEQVGMNQPALRLALNDNDFCNVLELPTGTHNCMDIDWKHVQPFEPIAVHIKGFLRLVCLGERRASGETIKYFLEKYNEYKG